MASGALPMTLALAECGMLVGTMTTHSPPFPLSPFLHPTIPLPPYFLNNHLLAGQFDLFSVELQAA